MPLLRIFLIAHVASTGRRVHVSVSCCARFSASKSKVAMHSWKCGAKNPNILSNAFMDGCEMKQSQNDHQKPNRSHNRSCFCCYSSYLLPSSASPPAKQSTSASTSSTCLMLELELESVLIHLKFKLEKIKKLEYVSKHKSNIRRRNRRITPSCSCNLVGRFRLYHQSTLMVEKRC